MSILSLRVYIYRNRSMRMTVWHIPYRQPSSISSSINCKASQLCSMANKAASGKKNHCNWSNCVELQSAKREISKHRETSNGASGGCTQVFVLLELSGCVLVGTPVVCNGLGHVQGPWSLRSNHAMPCDAMRECKFLPPSWCRNPLWRTGKKRAERRSHPAARHSERKIQKVLTAVPEPQQTSNK